MLARLPEIDFTGADGHAMGAGGTQCIAGVKKETPLWCEH